MATGVPRRGSAKYGGSRLDNRITLSYAGKVPEAEVLQTVPALPELIAVGREVAPGPPKRFYIGENLGVLAHLLRDPDISGKVRLIYIDPPFATQTVFHSRSLSHAYEDVLSGPEYVEFLRQRLIMLRELLADDGSLYVHLDAKMVFHIKEILDELFGPEGFRNCITRKKCNPKNYTRKQYGNVADYILFYTKTPNYVWNKPVVQWTEDRAKEYHYVDVKTGRRFMKVPVHAPGVRNGDTGKPWRGVLPPPGKHWQFRPSTLDEMDARGEIFWSTHGNPRRKVFLDESDGVGVQDIWMDFRDAHNQNVCITGYPTEKNPALLKRIIEASSNPGDIVLDCFSGSGTTLAVADGLDRGWVGVDRSPEALRTTLQRFQSGLEPMGDFVTKRRAESEEGRSLPLFASLDDAETPVIPKGHRLIADFVLYADLDLRDEALSASGGVSLFEIGVREAHSENAVKVETGTAVPVGIFSQS